MSNYFQQTFLHIVLYQQQNVHCVKHYKKKWRAHVKTKTLHVYRVVITNIFLTQCSAGQHLFLVNVYLCRHSGEPLHSFWWRFSSRAVGEGIWGYKNSVRKKLVHFKVRMVHDLQGNPVMWFELFRHKQWEAQPYSNLVPALSLNVSIVKFSCQILLCSISSHPVYIPVYPQWKQWIHLYNYSHSFNSFCFIHLSILIQNILLTRNYNWEYDSDGHTGIGHQMVPPFLQLSKCKFTSAVAFSKSIEFSLSDLLRSHICFPVFYLALFLFRFQLTLNSGLRRCHQIPICKFKQGLGTVAQW